MLSPELSKITSRKRRKFGRVGGKISPEPDLIQHRKRGDWLLDWSQNRGKCQNLPRPYAAEIEVDLTQKSSRRGRDCYLDSLSTEKV